MNEYLDWLSDNLVEPNTEDNISMKIYWRIVPKDNGYTYLGYRDGKYINQYKTAGNIDTSLMWENKSDCEDYIMKHLEPSKYSAEEILLNEKYYGIK